MIPGYDVSHYRVLNHTRAKAEGMTFALCKATEGTSYLDPTYGSQMAGIKAAGLIPGAYAFLSSGNGAGQCDYFLSVVGDPAGMLIALDVEAGSFADVQAWVARWRQRQPMHPLMIYSGSWYWSGHLGNPSAASLGCPLWDSRYVSGTGTAANLYTQAMTIPGMTAPRYGGWQAQTILQFSSSATVAGVAQVDVNAFWGTTADLLTFTGSAGATPVLEDDMTPAQEAKLDAVIAAVSVLYQRSMWNRNTATDQPGTLGGSYPSLLGLAADNNQIDSQLAAIAAKLNSLTAPPPASVDATAVAGQILAAVGPTLAAQVAEHLDLTITAGSK